MEEAVCCPEFDPVPWDDKIIEWKDKRFIKGRVRTLFYIPVNFGGAMRKLMKKIEGAGAANPDHLALSDHVSPWKMDVYVAVDREIPGERTRPSPAGSSARFTKGRSRTPALGPMTSKPPRPVRN